MTGTTTPTHPVTDALAEQLLHDLVAIASPSHHERPASAHLVAWMQAHGARDAYVDALGDAVGVFGTDAPTAREIVLLGHIDTFGGNPPVRLEGRTLYGRGTVDAKGPLCAFAAAAARAQLPADVRVWVMGAVEEEAASSAGARHLMHVVRPEVCIIGEPSQWDRITLGYKGRVLLECSFVLGHTHSANNTPTAPETAFDFWQQVRALTDRFNTDRTGLFNTLSSSLLDINTHSDGVHETARLRISFRLPPQLEPQALIDQVRALRDDFADFRWHGAEIAYTADKDSVLSRVMRGAIRAEGGTPRFVYKTGTSDMNVVGGAWDCPMVAYGPGDSALDHTPDEHIHLDEYLSAIRVLTRLLESL